MSHVVHSETIVDREGVTYVVRLDGKEKFRKRVLFGKAKTARAGGVAFRMAAKEQEEAAKKLLARAA